MKISVTPKDIANGKPGNGGLCPIALAIKRNGATDVCVDGSVADGTYKGHSFWADLPKKAKVFVKHFDQGWAVKPLSFTLNIK